MRWIKLRAEVVDDPAVMQIGERLGLDTPAVLGRLALVWLWADAQTVDGVLAGVTTKMLDQVARHEGFAQAMLAAGWLRERDAGEGGGFEIPNFLRHNGSSAKSRAMAALRQGRYSAGATRTGDGAGTVSGASAEKRRGEKKEEQSRPARPLSPGRASGAAKPSPPPPATPHTAPTPPMTDQDRGVGTSPELAGSDPRDRLKILRQLVLAERARKLAPPSG